MKTAITGVLSFALGALVALVCGLALRDADRARFRGDVLFPTQVIVANIAETLRKGEPALATRKIELLDRRLEEFRDGGRAPEIFVSEITELK